MIVLPVSVLINLRDVILPRAGSKYLWFKINAYETAFYPVCIGTCVCSFDQCANHINDQ